MTLNRLICRAASGYPDAHVLAYWDFASAKPRSNPQGSDTLAYFVALELAVTFDPEASEDDQVSEAVRAMTRAAQDLQSVICALEQPIARGGAA